MVNNIKRVTMSKIKFLEATDGHSPKSGKNFVLALEVKSR